MKKLLVPTDFSDNAMKAVTYAAELANRTGSTLFLLHVIEPVIDKIRQPYPLQEKLHTEIISNSLREMEALKATLEENYPGLVIETEVATGTVTTTILYWSKKEHPDLIVMGTQGASGLKEVFLGSVTGSIIGRTTIPVLAIPGEYMMEEPDSIVFTTNHFEQNREMLDKIVEISRLFKGSIHAVVFVDTDKSNAAYYIDSFRQLEHYLEFLKRTYPDISFTAEVLEGKDFEETIEKFDTNNAVDIIAMITYPKSFWDKLLTKSITRKMTFHSKIPVLAIPAY